jgi:hypothetical protein
MQDVVDDTEGRGYRLPLFTRLRILCLDVLIKILDWRPREMLLGRLYYHRLTIVGKATRIQKPPSRYARRAGRYSR